MKPEQKQRKCRHCQKHFLPDYRNRHHQYYCTEPECRRSAKAVSQRKWLRKPGNRDYFRGSARKQKIQQWRKAHPGYWRKRVPSIETHAEQSEKNPRQNSCNASASEKGTLQDFCLCKNPLLIGLISTFISSTSQEDIAGAVEQMIMRGYAVLGTTTATPCGLVATKCFQQ